MPEIIINYKNALAGESESNYNPNKGFSPDTAGIEVVRKRYRGLFMAGRSGVAYDTNLADKILASTRSSATKYYSIGNGGKIYETSIGTLPSHTLKTTESVKSYDTNSDILKYGINLFITSTLNITMCDLPVTTADNDWWTTVAGGDALIDSVPHRLFEFQGVMCITNGNKLCSWDGATHNDAALTLPAGWVIQDYEIINNRIYLAATNPNNSGGFSVQTRLFIWDGYSPTWIDEKPLTLSSLYAIKQLGGILFLFPLNELYYFNGNDAEFVARTGVAVNPHNVCVSDGQMFYPGTYGIKCYDFKTKGISTPVKFAGSNVGVLFIGYDDYINCFTTATTSAFYQFNANDSTDGVFTSDRYFLATTSLIKKVEICFADNLVTGAAYTFNLYNENLEAKHTENISYATDGAIHKKVFNINQIMDAFYFTLSPTNAACKSIRWIKIYYEPIAGNTTK